MTGRSRLPEEVDPVTKLEDMTGSAFIRSRPLPAATGRLRPPGRTRHVVVAPSSDGLTDVAEFDRKREAEIFLEGMKAAARWSDAPAVAPEPEVSAEAAPSEAPATEEEDVIVASVRIGCRSCRARWSSPLTAADVDTLRQRSTGGSIVLWRGRCPACGTPHERELDLRRLPAPVAAV